MDGPLIRLAATYMLCLGLSLGLSTATAGEPGRAAPGSEVDAAFRAVLAGWAAEVGSELLAGESPCGDRPCLWYAIGELPRAVAMKQLFSALGGLGLGGRVERLLLEGRRAAPGGFSLGLAVAPGKADQKEMAERHRWTECFLALIQTVQGRSVAPGSDLSKVPDDARFYLLWRLDIDRPEGRMAVTLMAPPAAPAFPEVLTVGPVQGCDCSFRVVPGEGPQVVGLAGWKFYDGTCRWVCTGPAKELE